MPKENPYPVGSSEWWGVENFNKNEQRAHEDLVNPDRAGAMGLGANYAGGLTSGIVDTSNFLPVEHYTSSPPPPAPPQPAPPQPAPTSPTVTASSVGTQPEGTPTPFGNIQGGLPGGLGVDWHRLLAEATGFINGQKTLGRELNEAEIAYRLAQVALTQAQASAVPSEIALREAQAALAAAEAAGIPSEIALRTAQASLAQAQAEYQQARVGIEEAQVSGYLRGAPTLEREKFLAEEQEKAYQRAANPARAFENELARSANAGAPAGQGTTAGFTPAFALNYEAPSGLQPEGPGEPMVRLPGFINAFRSGGYVPTAGQIPQPNTAAPASQAAVGEDAFRLANQATLANYNPDQTAILGSYGRAGGVSDERQQFWLNRRTASGGSATPTYTFAS